MKISVGPISCFWERSKVFEFYDALEDAPVDIAYLGETICSKRRQLALNDWLDIAEQLSAAGKEVVLSTLTLLEAESELASLRQIAENARFAVEANDMSAVHMLSNRHSFIAGPHINTYNAETLNFFYELGAKRWVVPVELGRELMREMQKARPLGMETEVIAFGRLPLAFSARCYTARAHNRPKDSCDFICLDYPDGLPLFTLEKKPFLILNGIQTQSAETQNLIMLLDELVDLEIDVIRIMPQSRDFFSIAGIFRRTLDGAMQPEAALQALENYQTYGFCNGYWYGKEGMAWINESNQPAEY